ncbi:hypothetical protein C804_03222 [Lachnospiraceae bacterium A4]|nr:hypothetical protein C804_03222 [Lachnospiraceae bacterium A4]
MSAKNLDNCNRWRKKTVAFRVSPKENEQIDKVVRLSGLTKQDYITRRLLCQDVVVQGNPRVYKALRNELAAVLAELQRIEAGGSVDNELLDTIELITVILGGLKGEGKNGE